MALVYATSDAVFRTLDRRTRAEIYLQRSGTKRAILRIISATPTSLSELARDLGMTPATVFQHGRELAELGLVTKDKVGGRAFLVLTPSGREVVAAGGCAD